jgi:hypothetical protein
MAVLQHEATAVGGALRDNPDRLPLVGPVPGRPAPELKLFDPARLIPS